MDGTAPGVFGADSGFTPGHTLPPGQMLRDYRIDAVLGEGGFGVVYLALDTALERRVAIKEYLPAGMASRARGSMTVFVKSASHRETFAAGLRSFVNEARLLARFDHPALVKVHQFWEQNGTAYMVMPYYEGPTLKRTLADLGRTPTETELRQWLMPLLDALAVLHAERCYHRDIAPDNILITPNGPLLLDFGAARRVIGDMTQALTAVLKPGFAPIEQYGEVPGMSQGPWTDIFALASVLYVALAGVKPMSSIERVMDDRLRPLSDLAAGRASKAFLNAVDQALALRPADRPQTVGEFLARLNGQGDLGRSAATARPKVPGMPAHAPGAPPAAADEVTVLIDLGFEPVEPSPAPARQSASGSAGAPHLPDLPWPGETVAPAPASASASASVPAARPAPASVPPPAPAPGPMPALAPTPAPRRAADGKASGPDPRRRAVVLSLAGGGLALAGAAGWLWNSRRGAAEQNPEAAAPAQDATASVLSPSSAAQSAAAPAPVPAPAPRPVPAPTGEPAPAIAAPPPDPPRPAQPPPPEPAAPPSELSPASAPSTGPARPARARPPPVAAPKPTPEAAGTAQRRAANQARCSDILQKASLEPITAGEAEFLKRECR